MSLVPPVMEVEDQGGVVDRVGTRARAAERTEGAHSNIPEDKSGSLPPQTVQTQPPLLHSCSLQALLDA